MNNILTTINEYIETPNTDYSIMINGKWGSGKTYFILNELKPFIEAKKGYNNSSFSVIYISLNGLNKLDSISEQVILARMPQNKVTKMSYGIAKSAINIIGNIPGDYSKLVQSFSQSGLDGLMDNLGRVLDFSTSVIVFDDLERIDKNVSIQSVLGYINSNFIEHQKIKVILVANTDKLFEDTSDYAVIQEKFIDRVIEYKSNLKGNLMAYAKTFFSGLSDSQKMLIGFVEENEFEILRQLEVAECTNLRTLRFILSKFERVLRVIDPHEFNNEYGLMIFRFILAISVEYKNGNIKLLIDEKENLLEIQTYRVIKLAKARNKQSSGTTEEPSFMDRFYDKYVEKNEGWRSFPSIYDYILYGALNEEALKMEIDILMEKNKIHLTFLNKLIDYYYQEDEQLNEIAKECIFYATKGLYKPYDYIILEVYLRKLIESGYIEVDLNYQESLKKGLQLVLSNKTEFIVSNSVFTNEISDYSELRLIIEEKQNESKSLKKNENINAFLSAMRDTKVPLYSSDIFKKVYQDKFFFTRIPKELFSQSIIVSSNYNLQSLISIYRDTFESVSNAGAHYYSEKAKLISLADEIDCAMTKVSVKPLKQKILQDLISTLYSCAEHLEATR